MMANLSTNDFNLNGIEHHWNKLCQTNRDDLQEPSDFFMAITHCCFIQSGFLCLGVGEGVRILLFLDQILYFSLKYLSMSIFFR